MGKNAYGEDICDIKIRKEVQYSEIQHERCVPRTLEDLFASLGQRTDDTPPKDRQAKTDLAEAVAHMREFNPPEGVEVNAVVKVDLSKRTGRHDVRENSVYLAYDIVGQGDERWRKVRH